VAEPRETLQRAWEFLVGRKRAYCRKLGNLEDRDTETILTDLAWFCYAHRPMPADAAAAARAEGRRDVWLRVARHLNLKDETLWLLYDGRDLTKGN